MAVQRERVIRAAEKHVSKGRIDAAIREYRKVLTDQPDDVSTLNRLGDLYARVQQYDEAVRLFERIAAGYSKDGFLVKAIAIYKKIIKLDPTRLEIYEKLAELYHRQGLVPEARSQYQVLADYYTQHGNEPAALGIYEKLVDLEPDNPSHHAKLAELHTEAGRVPEALEAYRTIAGMMLGAGHGEEAAQVFERGLDVASDDVEFARDAVMALRTAGHDEAADRFLALARERNPVLGRSELFEPAEVEQPGFAEVPEPEPVASEAASETVAEPEALPGEAVAPTEWPDEDDGAALDFGAALDAEEGDDELVLDLDGDLGEMGELGELEDLGVELSTPTPTDFAAAPTAAPEPAAPEPAAPEPTPPVGMDASSEEDLGEFELDLDDVIGFDEPEPASQVRPPDDMLDGRQGLAFRREEGEEPAAPAPAAPAQATPSTPDFEPMSAGEAAEDPNAVVAEALVLHKYGMTAKAVSQLEAVLAAVPGHAEARTLLARIRPPEPEPAPEPEVIPEPADAPEPEVTPEPEPVAEAGPVSIPAPELTTQPAPTAEAADTAPDPEPAPAPPAITADEPPARRKKGGLGAVDRMLRDLIRDVRPKRKKPAAESAPTPEPPAATPPPPPTPIPAEDPDDITLHGIFDEVEAGDTSSPFDAGSLPPEAAAPIADLTAGAKADTSAPETSWLDEAKPAASPSPAFADEDDFFDLAAELESELTADELFSSDEELAPAPKEQSLEEIVEGFKRGVSENLSTEDHDTHFNLGIAYREMGLIDEAIGEFQIACKRPELFLECSSLLGLSFLEKGLPDLAVKSYRRGLEFEELGELTEEQRLGLLYDLADAYLAAGDRKQALDTFAEVYSINSHYRDVVARVEELR